jgi:transglutaminase-like putative cysteine protease
MTTTDEEQVDPGVSYQVVHDTRYAYSGTVSFAQHRAHLIPGNHHTLRVLDHALSIDPAPADLVQSHDTFGNPTQYFSIVQGHDFLHVRAQSTVLRFTPPPTSLADSQPWESVVDAMRFVGGRAVDPVAEFRFPSPHIPLDGDLAAYARQSFLPGRCVMSAAIDLMQRIHGDFRYDSGSTQVETSVKQAFLLRRGVCQDFAHIMIAALRSLGLPARYVSGYLYTGTAACGDPGHLVGADASHAWVETYCPSSGWIELDPTNNMIAGAGHLRLAYGRDYADVAPLRGVIVGGGDHRLTVGVHVGRVP